MQTIKTPVRLDDASDLLDSDGELIAVLYMSTNRANNLVRLINGERRFAIVEAWMTDDGRVSSDAAIPAQSRANFNIPLVRMDRIVTNPAPGGVWLDADGRAFGNVNDEQIAVVLEQALADVVKRSGQRVTSNASTPIKALDIYIRPEPFLGAMTCTTSRETALEWKAAGHVVTPDPDAP